MSYLIAAPEMMTSAATDLASIGSDLSAAHTAAATPTVALVPAAADEVSASITHLFSGYAQAFQGLAGKAAAFHDQFVHTLKASAASYAGAEATAAASLQHATSTVPSLLQDLYQWSLTWFQAYANELNYYALATAWAHFVTFFFSVLVPLFSNVLVPLVTLLTQLGL